MSTNPFVRDGYGLMNVAAHMTLLTSLVEERCGEDARLAVLGDDIAIEQPVYFGKMPGTLCTDLKETEVCDCGECTELEEGLLQFRVAFRAVDDFEFEPIGRSSYCTNLPASLELSKQVVALTAIHETAKAHLVDGFPRAMALMSQLEPSVIEKLITN
jgi:hypothetical protein